MTELRDFLDAQVGAHCPSSQPDIAAVRQRVSARRRHRRVLALVSVSTVAVAVGGVAFGWQDSGGGPPADIAAPSPSVSSTPTDGRRGEVALDGMSSCVEQYSPAAIPTRGFAFDGTVTAIDRDSSPTGSIGAGAWHVTFAVDEWFVREDGSEVVVTISPPMPATDAGPADYAEGTRLLVSGETNTGGAQYLAWGCGFTRYYDPKTANEWRSATS